MSAYCVVRCIAKPPKTGAVAPHTHVLGAFQLSNWVPSIAAVGAFMVFYWMARR